MKFGFMDKLSNSKDRESVQKLFKGLVIVVIFLVVLFSVFASNDKKQNVDVGTFNITKEDKTLKARWMGEASKDIKTQDQSIKNLEKKMQDLQTENKKLEELIKNADKKPTNDTSSSLDKDGLYKNFPKPEGKTKDDLNKYVPQGIKSLEDIVGTKGDSKSNTNEEKVKNMFNTTPVVVHEVFQGSMAVENVAQKKSDDNTSKAKGTLDILPTGSIIKATLVNGMDAPTMSQAKDNPLITLMIVRDLAKLPNKYKYDLRECFILGEGYGDLSAERVYIRTNNLSCIAEDGEHIDFEIKGYAAGEDGKIGIRGEVVSKQGAVLARAIVAGFVDGVGKAFSQVGNTVQVTPYGTTTSNTDISSSELAKKGMYSGLSAGSSKLADFYLKLADQVYPVIEIAAGRDVDVVISNKRDMTTLEEGGSQNQNSNKDKK